MRLLTILAVVLFAALLTAAATPLDSSEPDKQLSLLVISKTAGFRHDSIPAGIAALREIASEHNYTITATEDAAIFTPAKMESFDVVIFLNTTGDILTNDQQAAFERFIQSGGGFVGIHSAADTEYDWPWYQNLIGAHFKSHPHIQQADILILDPAHPATRHLPRSDDSKPARWTRTDEWYNYNTCPAHAAARDNRTIRLLLALDESTYKGGAMGEHHPIAWCHEYDGGRAFYTGLGHTSESFAEPAFHQHLLGAIQWAANIDDSAPPSTPPIPD
jgi:type 1 glutamine amidotransferase